MSGATAYAERLAQVLDQAPETEQEVEERATPRRLLGRLLDILEQPKINGVSASRVVKQIIDLEERKPEASLEELTTEELGKIVQELKPWLYQLCKVTGLLEEFREQVKKETLREYTGKGRARRVPVPVIRQIRELWDKGLTVPKIKQELNLNIHTQTMRQIIRNERHPDPNYSYKPHTAGGRRV